MELTEAIRKRRTIRRYKQTPVEREKLEQLIEAARLAPTGGNMQQLRFIVIQNKELLEKVFKQTAWGGLVKPKRNPELGKSAPMAFIAVTSNSNSLVQVTNAGAAVQNILLRAVDLELGCCWIGAFNKENTHQALSLPEETELLYLVAVGYPDESPVSEDVSTGDSVKYYLDDQDVLHVPKLTVDSLTEWCD